MHVYFLISYTLLHKGFHTINGLLHFSPLKGTCWKPLCVSLKSCACCCFQPHPIPLYEPNHRLRHHSVICGHLGCFQHSANQTMLQLLTFNSASVFAVMQARFQCRFLKRSQGKCICSLLDTAKLSSRKFYQFVFPPTKYRVPISHSLINKCVVICLNFYQ